MRGSFGNLAASAEDGDAGIADCPFQKMSGEVCGRSSRSVPTRNSVAGLFQCDEKNLAHPLEHLAVDQRGRDHQLVPRVHPVALSRRQQIILFGRPQAMLYGQYRDSRAYSDDLKNLQAEARQTATFQYRVTALKLLGFDPG